MSDERLKFLCTQPQAVLARVIAGVLEELRSKITEAWLDAFTDGPWHTAQSADLQALLAVERRFVRAGERTVATGMGIDLDMSRDEEFGLLVRLAPHSIHSEAWAGDDLVFSSSDTGDHAWCALTPAEAARAAARLAALGLSFEEVLSYRE